MAIPTVPCRSALAGALLAALLGAPALSAQGLPNQDTPSLWDIKFHIGLTGGNVQKDHDDNKTFGLGLQTRIPLTPFSAITLELGYDMLAGRQTNQTQYGGPVYFMATYNDPTTLTTKGSTGQPLYLSPENSIDLRKEVLEGFAFKVGYTGALHLGEGSEWHAGLRLDDYQTQAEFTGTLIPMDPGTGAAVPVQKNSPSATDSAYYEGWATQVKKTSLKPGVYAGLGFRLMEGLRLETDVRTVGYTHYTVHPFTYSGQPFSISSSSRTGYAVEVALAMNF